MWDYRWLSRSSLEQEMAGGHPDAEAERLTATATEAAETLGLSRSRVLQLLANDSSPLSGPPSTGRGRGHDRLVWVDAIEAEQVRRRSTGTQGSTRTDGFGATLDALAEDLESLRAEVRRQAELLSTFTPVEPGFSLAAENAKLRWALIKTNAANDLLHEAADRQDEAQDADRRAAELRAQAYTLVRRSDRMRSEIFGAGLMPDDPNDATGPD